MERPIRLLFLCTLALGGRVSGQSRAYPDISRYLMARDSEVALAQSPAPAAIAAPICFTAPAARTALPYYELRTRLAIAGKNPEEIADALQRAYVRGELPRRDGVTFAYMWSAHQQLGPGVGAWRPHMMVFAPYYDNTMVGGNEFGSPFPQVSDDAGTSFTVVVIPVDPRMVMRVDSLGGPVAPPR